MPPIVRVAIVFIGGALLGNQLAWFAPAVLIGAAVATLSMMLSRGRETPVLIVIAVLGVGLGAFEMAEQRSGCPRIEDGARVEVAGHLQASPTADKRTVPLAIPGLRCRGAVRVRLPDRDVRYHMGDPVRITGVWLTLRIAPGGATAADGLILASEVGAEPSLPPHRLLRMRARAQQRIHELFPAAYPLADALLIAQRENIHPEVRESFAASGLTHLLAISGTHVALVAATLLLIARLLRSARGVAAAAAIAGSAAYVFFLGAPHAALRALIQMLLVSATHTLQRPANPLGLLAAAAIAITAIDAAAPLDPGFQLSFAGIFGIVSWRRPLLELLPASLPLPIREAMATTVAATAATTPIAAFHFGVVSIISLLANLLAIPVVSIAVPVSAAALALSGVDYDVARFVAAGAELPLLWLSHIATWCARVPGGHVSITPAAAIVATMAVTSVFVAARGRSRSTLIGRAAAGLLAGALPLTLASLLPLAERSLQIHMIDVGQGDAFAIRSPRGRWILVDGGPVSEKFDAGKRSVMPFLRQHQAARLEAVVLSHPHLDHFGGLGAVARQLDIAAIIDPMLPVPSAPYDSLLALAQAMRIPWLTARPGSVIELDGVRLDFLRPTGAPVDASVDPNDYSAVFRLSYEQFSALFLGDLPAAEERQLVREFGTRLDVDLLKVAHHGSNGSSATELLVAASPQVALISAGRRNRYGHPGGRVLAQLKEAGVRTYRSDRDGSVTIRVDRAGRMLVKTAQ